MQRILRLTRRREQRQTHIELPGGLSGWPGMQRECCRWACRAAASSTGSQCRAWHWMRMCFHDHRMPDCRQVSSSSASSLGCQTWQAASAHRTGLRAHLGSQLCSGATANEPDRMLRALKAIGTFCLHQGPLSEDTPLTTRLTGCNTEGRPHSGLTAGAGGSDGTGAAAAPWPG